MGRSRKKIEIHRKQNETRENILNHFAKKNLLDEFKELVKKHGMVLSRSDIEQLAENGECSPYATYLKYWGTMKNLYFAANVEPPSKVDLRRKGRALYVYSPADKEEAKKIMRADFLKVKERLGRNPTKEEIHHAYLVNEITYGVDAYRRWFYGRSGGTPWERVLDGLDENSAL